MSFMNELANLPKYYWINGKVSNNTWAFIQYVSSLKAFIIGIKKDFQV